MVLLSLIPMLGFATSAEAGTCRRITVYTGVGYDPYVDVCEP